MLTATETWSNGEISKKGGGCTFKTSLLVYLWLK